MAGFPAGMPFTPEDWENTPKPVREAFAILLEQVSGLRKRIEELESRLNMNSGNSAKPPSSDSPYKRKSAKTASKRRGGPKKGHRGHRQKMMDPTKTVPVPPGECSCGNADFPETEPYYTHQVIELPEIRADVTHFILHKGACPCCGRIGRAKIPRAHRTGYGPRFSALVGEICGIQGNSRNTLMEFCASVLGIPISKGAVQKIIDRVSAAIEAHYEAIGRAARKARVNFIDETSWFMNSALIWLWTMTNTSVAFFKVHRNRSKEAFLALIGTWEGILVSDGYGVYAKWVNFRQTCLAHLIRKAKGLSERSDPEIALFGEKVRKELGLLCHMAKAPPSREEWNAFYARFITLIFRHNERKDAAGKLARQLAREMNSLFVFLQEKGVEPTNNRAERALRFGVLWRKRSLGTESEKGNRWVERIMSLKQTCALRSKPTFPILADAVDSYFKEQTPDVSWI